MGLLFVIAAVLAGTYGVLWYFIKRTVWCRSQTCLVGKTTIITGANTGIGYETALDFAKRGARVILACRDPQRAEEAKIKIINKTGNNNVVAKIVDFASFASVRAFAKDVNATEERLDILVNNAGISFIGDKISHDGLNLVMQVNHFSNFLLTNLLIGLLKKSAPSRIINVSSRGAKHAILDLDDLQTFKSNLSVYSRSKACNILFTEELAEKLKGTQVTTYSLHPGIVKTDILRHLSRYQKMAVDLFNSLYMTCEEGAQTTIFTAVEQGIEEYNGEHFDNCQRIEPYKSVAVPGLAKKLWEKSEQVVNLKPEEIQF